MSRDDLTNRACRPEIPVVRVLLLILALCVVVYGEGGKSDPAKLRIFDGTAKTIVVNGYSTSFQWPRLLQDKLDRMCNGERILTVKPALKGGTPVVGWIDVKTGRPSQAWLKILRPKLRDDRPVIVLAQQSLQGVFGRPAEGIGGPDDKERIRQGADALEKYVRLLKRDGADIVFVATHIYKHPMEPAIGNERYALAELLRRQIPSVVGGPDVWTPTKERYPQAFGRDGVHPNRLGAEIMAQKWFEALLRYDGLAVPAWSTRPVRPRSRGEIPGVRVLRDIEYVPGGHERQRLDLYLPASAGQGPVPVIIWVHGGAWRAGSKERCPARRFVERGYAVASINYRLSQHAIFPAQIEDCKAAVRYLRANAGRYGLDAGRFGAWGSSAGGHLVALLGTAGDVKMFERGPNLDVSSRVQAVCDYYGPTDLTVRSRDWAARRHDSPDSPLYRLLGGPVRLNQEKCKQASPVSYVSEDDPPFLIVHGDKDPVVPHNQSEILYRALVKAGVEAKLYTVKGGGHGGFKDPSVEKMVEEFFDAHLKGAHEGG